MPRYDRPLVEYPAEPDSLTELLDDLRATIGSDVMWMFLRSGIADGEFEFVAGSGERDSPIPGEQMLLGVNHPARVQHMRDVLVSSRSREFRVLLGEALVIPWGGQRGGGVVVSGMPAAGHAEPGAVPAVDLEARWVAERAMALSRTRREFSRAVREVSAAVLERRDTSTLLQSVLSTARRLFGTDVAYISLGDSAGDQRLYRFAATLGIVTSQFRRIELQHDHGLGGLARRRRTPVNTVEYGEDTRFEQPPLGATRAEGIHSAMCSPLVIDGDVAGCLYVGNRRLSAFGAEQLDTFAEFTDHVALGVGAHELDRHRTAILRRQEREQLASRVHESVVRGLVEIGWTVEAATCESEPDRHADRLRQVGDLAVGALEALRGELAELSAPRSPRSAVPVGQVLARLDAVSPAPGLRRDIRVHPQDLASLLDPRLADALESIGSEALVNSNLHSTDNQQILELTVDSDGVALSVTDGAAGEHATFEPDTPRAAAGHLGQSAIRRKAHDLGGSLHMGPLTGGGWRVEVWLPRGTGEFRS